MRLGDLRVVHLSKQGLQSLPGDVAAPRASLGDAVFFLDSCQRKLWVSLSEFRALPSGAQSYRGIEAYRFLLSVAAGLESQIAGETDIFGQLKEAWHKQASPELSYWMQKIFEDTKLIRSQYLQNLGGASYGSLVRKLMKDGKPGPVLLLGAGQIASAVAPYLLDFESELLVCNRSNEKLATLLSELRALKPEALERVRVLPYEQELEAWSRVSHAVVCIPLDAERDRARAAAWQGESLVHLGGYRDACGPWRGLKGFHSLEDVFALEKNQSELRLVQLSRARAACLERARLRSLGGSITIPHGWEDLAVFA